MEIKINKEIRNYYEQFLMGMSLRNIIFSALGIAAALLIGFNLKGRVSTETMSWIIPASVVPFFLVGFKKINNMYIEKFIIVIIRAKILFPRKLLLKDDTIYRTGGRK